MAQTNPIVADLLRAFPQLSNSEVWENTTDLDGQWLEFAKLVTGLYQRENYGSVQSAFDRLEEFLQHGSPAVRSWVTGFLQSLQDVTNWSSSNIDIFVRFLGPNARRIWETLEAIRSDLESCSILEAEILMWRVVHHKPDYNRDLRNLS